MRKDQVERMRDLVEKLADVVLEEADPDMWSGKGVEIAAMTSQQRGDRYWCKKNAAATFALLERAAATLERCEKPEDKAPDAAEADLEREITRREKEAGKVLDGVLERARKSAFDSKTHGKA